MKTAPAIAVFGASGLIGEAIAASLQDEGIAVLPVARRFTAAQRGRFGPAALEIDFMTSAQGQLAELLTRHHVDIVVNCVGVLQDGPKGKVQDVHINWIERLLAAMPQDCLLVHFSVPGTPADDRTAFSRSKHQAEAAIVDRNRDFVVLRPGFVLAPTAYGGSALLRGLASLPLSLPKEILAAPLWVTDMTDIARSVVAIAVRWRGGERGWRNAWDIMSTEPTTVGDVLDGLARRLGGPIGRAAMPRWLMDLGARMGDLVALAGWVPPVRSTALAELRRGVTGDPAPWIAATGFQPHALAETLRRLPVGVQERWFGRLYLLKSLLLTTLAVFWLVSGTIALTIAFGSAVAILGKAGLAEPWASVLTIATSFLDLAIGLAIAVRKSAKSALWSSLAVSLGYILASSVVAPALWADPVGAMVKTVPVVVLTLVALAILDDR